MRIRQGFLSCITVLAFNMATVVAYAGNSGAVQDEVFSDEYLNEYQGVAMERVREYRKQLDSLPDKERWEGALLYGSLGTELPEWTTLRLLDSTGLTMTVHRKEGQLEFSDKNERVFFKFGRPVSEIAKDGCPEYEIHIQRVEKDTVFFSQTCIPLSGKLPSNVAARFRRSDAHTTFCGYNIKKHLLISEFLQFFTQSEGIKPEPRVQETPTGYKVRWRGTITTYNPRQTEKGTFSGIWTWTRQGNDLDCTIIDEKGKRMSPEYSSSVICYTDEMVSKPLSIKH